MHSGTCCLAKGLGRRQDSVRFFRRFARLTAHIHNEDTEDCKFRKMPSGKFCTKAIRISPKAMIVNALAMFDQSIQNRLLVAGCAVMDDILLMVGLPCIRITCIYVPPGRGCRLEVYHGEKPLGFLRVSFRVCLGLVLFRVSFRVLLVLPQFCRDFTFQAYLRCHVRCRF